MRLTQIVEALLFASDAPLTAADLARADERLDEDTVTAVIDELRAEYDRGERAFQIQEVAGGYQMLTRADFAGVLERYRSVPQSSRLSMPALEVLAIIAYRQPLGRLEIEEIRGVQSSAVLRTLQDRELIETVARGEGLGRPLLYGTTKKFLEHFGFDSLEDLPRPDDLPVVLREPAPGAAELLPAVAIAEPTPLSEEAEAEAEALELHVQPARSHALSETRNGDDGLADGASPPGAASPAVEGTGAGGDPAGDAWDELDEGASPDADTRSGDPEMETSDAAPGAVLRD